MTLKRKKSYTSKHAAATAATHEHNQYFGIHACRNLIKTQPDIIQTVFCTHAHKNNRALTELITTLQHKNIHIQYTAKENLDRMSHDQNHQGIICITESSNSALYLYDESDLEVLLETKQSCLILILDHITDPHNMGACLRNADAFGVDFVIFTKDHNAPITATVHKIASGATQYLKLVCVTNLARTMDKLKAEGIWITGLDGEAPAELHDLTLTGKLALVMGSEGTGMRKLTRDKCDHLAKLPMYGKVSSFNVSVATGIALYEATQQRKQSI